MSVGALIRGELLETDNGHPLPEGVRGHRAHGRGQKEGEGGKGGRWWAVKGGERAGAAGTSGVAGGRPGGRAAGGGGAAGGARAARGGEALGRPGGKLQGAAVIMTAAPSLPPHHKAAA